MMKKLFFLVVLALLAMGQASAIPASPHVFTITQPDGSTLSARIVGDEYYNFYTTADGFTIMPNEQGYYVYAAKQNGKLVPTSSIARDAEKRTAAEKAMLEATGKRATDDEAFGQGRSKARARNTEMSKIPFNANNFKGLIVLVNFTDETFTRSDVKEFYQNMINLRGYTGYTNEDGSYNSYGNFTGSVRDYYYDGSFGKFDPTFDVVGPVDINYGVNYARQTQNASALVRAAITKANQEIVANGGSLSDYDLDNDGNVDMVYFIFAGVGSNTGEATQHIWPHASYNRYRPTGADAYMFRYACSCEYYSKRANILDGIGTMCHEFGHVMGLPDLYDADYESNGQSHDPGTWEIMAGAGYNNYGRTPATFSAFDRYFMGFLSPTVVITPDTYTLNPLLESNEAYILPSGNNKEYFIVENRQRTSWDSYLEGHGMLVFRVDSTSTSVWSSNSVNNYASHNYYEMVRAGSSTDGETSHDPFPGTNGVTMLTNTTKANLMSWNKKKAPRVLYNITENADSSISFVLTTEAELPESIVEDFESMPTATGWRQSNVEGAIATWTFTNSRVNATSNDAGNGEHAVMMQRSSLLRTTTTIDSVKQIVFDVYNPTTSAATYKAYYSTDGSSWTQCTPTAATASANTNSTLFFQVPTAEPVYVRINQTSGVGPSNGTNNCMVDDVRIYFVDPTEKLIGDVWPDGVIDATDVTALVSILLGNPQAGDDIEAADVNGDGNIDAADVTALIGILLGN